MADEGRSLGPEEVRDRYRGCLLGLAVGDALGTTLEFSRPENGGVEPITDLVGGGPFHLAPGQWTDDTSMALCLAESLCECGGVDPKDQMDRYLRWYREGYRSSTGTCFDIGNTTRDAIGMFERSGNPLAGPTDEESAGNGSLMRLAPVPMAFLRAVPRDLLRAVILSSQTTHGAPEAVDACLYLSGLLVTALLGGNRETILSPRWFPIHGVWRGDTLAAGIDAVAGGSFLRKTRETIRSGGYVVETLEAALWAFHHTGSFEEGALKAVNLGHDADTVGAVYGQLAGAYYGLSGIPPAWAERIDAKEEIIAMADRLFTLSGVEDALAHGGSANVHSYRIWDSGLSCAAGFAEMRAYRAAGIGEVLERRHRVRPENPRILFVSWG